MTLRYGTLFVQSHATCAGGGQPRSLAGHELMEGAGPPRFSRGCELTPCKDAQQNAEAMDRLPVSMGQHGRELSRALSTTAGAPVVRALGDA